MGTGCLYRLGVAADYHIFASDLSPMGDIMRRDVSNNRIPIEMGRGYKHNTRADGTVQPHAVRHGGERILNRGYHPNVVRAQDCFPQGTEPDGLLTFLGEESTLPDTIWCWRVAMVASHGR